MSAIPERDPGKSRGLMAYPPSRWRRAMFRAPLYLWRMGLGRPLSAARMIVLTTRGRKSGLPRHTMVECTSMDGRLYIVPGWGERAHWYRNVLADPKVTVQHSGKIWGAIARRVTDREEVEPLYSAARQSPVWKDLLAYWGVRDTLRDFLAADDRLVVLRLDPLPEPPLPSVKSDLLWIWPVLGFGGFLLLRRRDKENLSKSHDGEIELRDADSE